MTILVPWENDGQRLLLTIESKSLKTHSCMQHLSETEMQQLRRDAKDLLANLTDVITNASKPKLD